MLNPAEIASAPTIKLGAFTYPIPMLAPRQQRIVIPTLMKLMAEMTAGGADSFDTKSFSGPQYDALLSIVHTAITRAQPTLTMDEFIDRDCELSELMAALDVISAATGLIKRAPAGAPPSGEAQPAA
jgi:hypothetical protein